MCRNFNCSDTAREHSGNERLRPSVAKRWRETDLAASAQHGKMVGSTDRCIAACPIRATQCERDSFACKTLIQFPHCPEVFVELFDVMSVSCLQPRSFQSKHPGLGGSPPKLQSVLLTDLTRPSSVDPRRNPPRGDEPVRLRAGDWAFARGAVRHGNTDTCRAAAGRSLGRDGESEQHAAHAPVGSKPSRRREKDENMEK